MARLKPGENAKIDEINKYVELVQSGGEGDGEAMSSLLEIFHPLILRLCKKWSNYFDDAEHRLISWSQIVNDAQYWMYKYTVEKYIPDGRATYNNFIKNHLDMRIRYMYEQELNYRKKYIFPDPDKNDPSDDTNMLESVIQRYASRHENINVEDDVLGNEHTDKKKDVAIKILSMIGDERYFTRREKDIFVAVLIHNKTHEDIGAEMGISRPRVSQVIGKVRRKLTELLDDNVKNWWEAIE